MADEQPGVFEVREGSGWHADRIREDIEQFRGAHHIDIRVRKDGRDIWVEGDWLKYMREVEDAEGEA